MAVASIGGRNEHLHSKLIPTNNGGDKRTVVPVVYYLSRNGQLEHPHFMEVPLSSSHGLFLRDVINRLNLLRGKGMATQYSWSSKMSYKNGYVWHDLEENDFIHPVHGGEYVLKGSEVLETVPKSPETFSSNTPEFPPAGRNRRRNQSWGAIDLHEYKVYKAGSTRESDASTQTEDKRRRRIRLPIKEENEGDGKEIVEEEIEISPPPSDSSPETLESLIKADGRLILAVDESKRTVGQCSSGRMKASSVLMSLISCGSIPFRDCGAVAVVSHYKNRVPHGGNRTVGGDHGDGKLGKVDLQEKGYFSGSLLMEKTNKDEIKLMRSSSYNADRSWQLKPGEKELEEGIVRGKCMPRRPKIQRADASNNKECPPEISSSAVNNAQQEGTKTEGSSSAPT